MQKDRAILLIILIFLTNSTITYCQKSYQIIKTSEKMVCDGILNEEIWQYTEGMKDFIQNNPSPGQQASQASIVKMTYDDNAIYIGAHLYDNEPDKILKEYTIRDKSGNADRFGISFDTYADGINAFNFEITASGIQIDKRITTEGEDINWDAVWESEVKITKDGWIVEMIIPYNAIRFPKKEIQTWRVQAYREIRRLREFSTWNEQKPEIKGEVNQYGLLHGLKNVKSPIRISLTPYISSYYDVIGRSNNQSSIHNVSYAAGMDLKYGINDAYTLDMTLIPDFGQVISDQQILNLTPFEVYFDENRPFFTEGLDLFNKGNMFYSRRVGGTPYALNEASKEAKKVNGKVLNNPLNNKLINVSKLSGRNSSGLGFGLFNGIEAQTNASIQDGDGKVYDVTTNPLTNYSVIVVDQNLKNNSNISFMNTNVMRQGSFADANVTGIFLNLKDSSQTYQFSLNPIYSTILKEGKNKSGFANYLNVGKISGNWIYSLENRIESADLDLNDLGFLRNPNEVSTRVKYGFNNYKPKNENIIFYRLSHSASLVYLFNPMLYSDFNNTFDAFVLFKSRMGWNSTIIVEPLKTRDYFEPRTGNFDFYMTWLENIRLRQYISSDYRKKLAIDASVNYRYFLNSSWTSYDLSMSPRYRFNDRFSLTYRLNLTQIFNELGYFNSSNFNLTEINPKGDPILGIRDRNIVVSTVTGSYIFNKNLGLDCRVRHYWAKVEYDNYGVLNKEGQVTGQQTPDLNLINAINNNLNLFNVDLQLRWRFRPGSDLYIVWKNSITKFDRNVDYSIAQNLKNTFEEPQNNSLSLRAIYWLDINKVRI